MKSITWVMTGMWVTLLVAPVATKAEVLARYHFNGRTEYGQRTKRPHDSFAPYNGSHYVPNVASGETGPTLENPGGGGYSPARCNKSARLRPAAATRMRT